jgi:hypothetical protein
MLLHVIILGGKTKCGKSPGTAGKYLESKKKETGKIIEQTEADLTDHFNSVVGRV